MAVPSMTGSPLRIKQIKTIVFPNYLLRKTIYKQHSTISSEMTSTCDLKFESKFYSFAFYVFYCQKRVLNFQSNSHVIIYASTT